MTRQLGVTALILAVALGSAACEMLSNPIGPTPSPDAGPGPAPAPVHPLDRVVELARGDIAVYWQRMWPQAGAPNLRRIAASAPTGCGPIDPRGPGAYCPMDRTIYLSDPALGQMLDQFGDFAVVTVMAHEWGHHIQAAFGRPGGLRAAGRLLRRRLRGRRLPSWAAGSGRC